jgi:hypothetical protein
MVIIPGSLLNPDFALTMKPRIPMGHRALPEDIVGATIFFASKASDSVTGQISLWINKYSLPFISFWSNPIIFLLRLFYRYKREIFLAGVLS